MVYPRAQQMIGVLAASLAAGAAFAPPAATAGGTPPWAGTFYAVRAGADSLQDLTLVLDPSGKARLTTRYPGYTKTAAGTRVYPMVEIGAWTQAKGGILKVTFRQKGQIIDDILVKDHPDGTTYSFKLIDSVLSPTNYARDPSAPLFHKADCR